MAFVIPALAAIGGGSALAGGALLASTAVGAYGAAQQGKAAKAAANASKQQASVEPPPKPQAPKTADYRTLLAANSAAAGKGGSMSGNSGTFLTGPAGVPPGALTLGHNLLLGQ